MLVRDEQLLVRHEKRKAREVEAEHVTRYVEDQLAAGLLLATQPDNFDKQLGKGMTDAQLEAILTQLNPRFVYIQHPRKPDIKGLYYQNGEDLVYLCAYHRGLMPEYSVFNVVEEDLPDPTVRHVDRKDLPKAEWQGLEKGFAWDPTQVRPGFKRNRRPDTERRRGWRTVLAKVIEVGLATPTQVENLVGSADHRSWAAHLGKQKVSTPW